jgi:glycine C-acetyltransferase
MIMLGTSASAGKDAWPRFRLTAGPQDPVAEVNGRRVINLSSNNYLCLTRHPKIRAAANDAIMTHGISTCASRAIIGTSSLHEELERRIAHFLGCDTSVFFMSGFTANLGVLGAVLSAKDIAIGDEWNHESIIDGVSLSRATYRPYRHLDLEDLEEALSEAQERDYRKIVLATDGVFSLSGEIAPLPRIAELAQQYGAITLVDDSHAMGVLGTDGRGTVELFKLSGDWIIQGGTFSKALGVVGGCVACSFSVREIITANAHTLAYTTAESPPIVAACIASLDVLQSDEGKQLIETLKSNTGFFKSGLSSLGFDIGASQTPITPIVVQDPTTARQLCNLLFEEGCFVFDFGAPVPGESKGLLRTIVTAGHTKEQLSEALDAFAKVGGLLKII